MDTVWYWPSSGKPWRVHVNGLGQLPEHCLVPGYQKCQEIQVYTTTIAEPGAEPLPPPRMIGAKRILLADYFPEGKYRIRAYFSGTTTPVTAWFVTKGTNVRQEVFCYGSGFSWPRRATSGQVAVDWVIDYSGAAPATLPATTADCGNLPDGTATLALKSDAVRLY